jgi:hypothetical protein
MRYAYFLTILGWKGNIAIAWIEGKSQHPSRGNWGSDWGTRDKPIAAGYLVMKIKICIEILSNPVSISHVHFLILLILLATFLLTLDCGAGQYAKWPKSA